MRLTLQKKIFLYTAGLVVGTLAIIFFIMDRRIEADLLRFAESDLLKSQAVFRELEKARFHRLVSLTHVIAEVPVLKAVVSTGDPATVVEAAVNYQKVAGSDLFIVTDRHGRVLARTHNPTQHGDSLRENPLVASALKGEAVVGTLLYNNALYQTVARPLSLQDHLLGTLVLGYRVDDALAAELQRMTGTEVAFLLGPRILATSLSAERREEMVRLLVNPLRQRENPWAQPAGRATGRISLGREPFLVLQEKVTESGSRAPVALSILKSLRPSLAVRARIGRNLLWMGLGFLVSAMGLAFFLSRTITGSLRSLLQGTRRISAGDLNQPIETERGDEIGELARAFNQMMENLRKSQAEVEDYSRHLESRVRNAMERLRQSQALILRSEKLASIGKLASGVAHEILNPVNVIGLHAQSWLQQRELEPQIRKSFAVISEQVQRTTRITEGLRRFSRQTAPQKNRIDLRELLEETINLVAHEFRLNAIEVEQALEPGLPHIQGDKDQLTQVFLNLFTNARDAMPNGGRLTLRAKAEGADDGRPGEAHRRESQTGGNGSPGSEAQAVVVCVEDTGEGIPENLISKIFDPFFTTKPVDKGTGLGLFICHSIIEAHGGEIQVQSRVNQGTVFTVRLPAGD